MQKSLGTAALGGEGEDQTTWCGPKTVDANARKMSLGNQHHQRLPSPPPTGSGAARMPGLEGQACVESAPTRSSISAREGRARNSFGNDELVRAGRAQRRRLIRHALSPSGQEIMGLSWEEGGRGPNPSGNSVTEKKMDSEERKG